MTLTLTYDIMNLGDTMKFVTNLKQEEYTKFWKNHKMAHFMNSYEWGIVNKENRHLIPVYVGLKDDKGHIKAEAVLMKKETPLHMCYFYVPRGYVIDYDNKELLKEFTDNLKSFLKKENAIYLKIDPPISYQDIDEEAKPIPNGHNNYELFNYLKELGYIHKGFNKLYEHNQPRYTFRTYFKNYKDFSEVEQTISKTFMRSIKRSYNYDLTIECTDKVDDFYNLIQRISNKDGFASYSKKYYEDVFKVFKDNNYVKNFIAKINPQKVIKKYQELIKTEKNKDKVTKMEKDIAFLSDKGDKEIVIASLICTYTEKGAWSMYIGNDEIAEYTGTVNRLYYEYIKDAYDQGKDFADLFGTVGDPHTTYHNLAGLHEYKRKLGGTYVEFIGEFDLVNKPFWYKVLPTLLKIYRKHRK